MSDLNRILSLAGLRRLDEMFSRNPSINDKIEAVLNALPKETQTRAAYILDALHSAGQTGLNSQAWMQKADELYGDKLPRSEFSPLIKALPFCIKRLDDGTYVWNEGNGGDAQKDAMAGQQIKLTQDTMRFMRDKGEFTRDELHRFLAQKGVPPQMVPPMADHMLNQFGGLIRNLGNGRMEMQQDRPETAADHMKSFRDILNRGGEPPAA